MYCTQCGTPQDDPKAMTCKMCGAKLMSAILSGESVGNFDFAAPAGAGSNVSVPNYLVQAILVTLFCCIPFGIPAIVYASQVDGKLRSGDVAGAQASSKNAKTWCWVSFWITVIFLAMCMVISLILPATGVQRHR